MENVTKGKKAVILISCLLIGIDLITTMLSLALQALSGNIGSLAYESVESVIRLGLSALILFFLYKGHRWARIILIVLLISSIGLVLLTISYGGFISLLYIAIYIFCLVLLFSKPLKAYQVFKRTGAVEESPTL